VSAIGVSVALAVWAGFVSPTPCFASTYFVTASGYASDNLLNDRCTPTGGGGSASCGLSVTHIFTGFPGLNRSGDIQVLADAKSGNMTVSAQSSGVASISYGAAEIGETLTFAGNIMANTTVTINMTGFWALGNHGSAIASLELQDPTSGFFTGGSVCAGVAQGGCFYNYPGTKVSVTGSSYAIQSKVNISAHRSLLAIFEIQGDSESLFQADSSSTFVSDPITIDLPPGVTFTSASGEFLTAVGGVPETSTWAMMLIGFAGLGLAGYRRAWRPAIIA